MWCSRLKYILVLTILFEISVHPSWNLNPVKPRFSKFTFKKSWLENYLVKSRLKSLKITKSQFININMVYFFCEVSCWYWGDWFQFHLGDLPLQKSKLRFNQEKARFIQDGYNFDGINRDLSEILSLQDFIIISLENLGLSRLISVRLNENWTKI